MQNFFEHLQSHKMAPGCIRCGSFFRQEFFFCRACFENQILKYENFQESTMDVGSIDVTTLFQWVPHTSDSLSLAIHLLKRAESKLAWKYLGKLFADFLKTNSRTKINFSNAVLVPVPGRSLSSVHTKYFSNELAKNLGIKNVDLIYHRKALQDLDSTLRPQKELTRRQRLEREFDLCVDFTRAGEVENLQNIVLIDDVVTTGATLQACTRQIRALKPKVNVCAWVMFKRL